MNTETLRGHWNEMKGTIKKQWGKLTDDEIQQINGDQDKLIGTLQKHYGYSKEQAQREIQNLFETTK